MPRSIVASKSSESKLNFTLILAKSYTFTMEIAITLPNEVVQRAEETSRQLGISLNELCSQALSRFLETSGESEITRKLNEIYAQVDSSPDPVLSQMQFATLEHEDW